MCFCSRRIFLRNLSLILVRQHFVVSKQIACKKRFWISIYYETIYLLQSNNLDILLTLPFKTLHGVLHLIIFNNIFILLHNENSNKFQWVRLFVRLWPICNQLIAVDWVWLSEFLILFHSKHHLINCKSSLFLSFELLFLMF